MFFHLRMVIPLLILLVCLTKGSELIKKLDQVRVRNELNCTNDITKCGPHGECVLEQKTGDLTELICKCDHHYITVKSACDYKQRSQLAAFLLSLFFWQIWSRLVLSGQARWRLYCHWNRQTLGHSHWGNQLHCHQKDDHYKRKEDCWSYPLWLLGVWMYSLYLVDCRLGSHSSHGISWWKWPKPCSLLTHQT